MTALAARLADFLARNPQCTLVELVSVKGSAPREAGTWMLVSRKETFGTIGGGQLEYMAIDKARGMAGDVCLAIPLGPEIGQCCGGRVEVAISVVDAAIRKRLITRQSTEDRARPHVYLFGGGHVGHALASALALLPVHVVVVETREDALAGIPDAVETRLTSVPEQSVRDAPAGAAFLVLTHDHALDFLIVAEALKRDDASYVGMIGSRTKKATFKNWYLRDAGGSETALSRLVCPIGGDAVRDKRPSVIAAMAASEVMVAFSQSCQRLNGPRGFRVHAET